VSVLLNGKVAIVTGAGSGMGASEALMLAAEGAKVVVTDIDASRGRDIAERIGPSAICIEHDVADEAGWSAVVAAALRHFGAVNILVNNAGVPGNKKIQDTDPAFMRRVIDVNLMGTYLGMRAVIEPMKKAGGGAIVNIASGLAFTSLPGFFPYGASKWAVRGMTRLAAKDLAEFKIRVINVTPGAIETPMLEPSVRANQATLMPLGRVGTCEEFARVVVFAVSDSAAYVSGAEIMVDGAMLC
jgi:3alpha(or 20beta)-hydroxysteroid dehydrogenase